VPKIRGEKLHGAIMSISGRSRDAPVNPRYFFREDPALFQ
jgi:hypothetical protein